MRSSATTVSAYLKSLPADRRLALSAVRRVIRTHLPTGYQEAMNWGMITYQVPLRTYPDTHNGQPLMYAALASQKNYMAVYLTAIYTSPETYRAFEKAYQATGKRWDVGKSCVRFRTLDDCHWNSSVSRSHRCPSRRSSNGSRRRARRDRSGRRTQHGISLGPISWRVGLLVGRYCSRSSYGCKRPSAGIDSCDSSNG